MSVEGEKCSYGLRLWLCARALMCGPRRDARDRKREDKEMSCVADNKHKRSEDKVEITRDD